MALQLNSYAREKIRTFQIEDSEFTAQHKKAMLGHKTGMGKSLIALATAARLGAERILVLGGKSSASTWNKEPMCWCDKQTQFIAAPGSWDEALSAPEGVWHCVYDTFRNCMRTVSPWKRPHWDLIIADEAHRLRNRKTKWFEQFRRVESDYFIPMSATWASRGPQDLWPLLYMMDRKRFSSYWRFVNTYCFVEKSTFGTEIFGARNTQELRDLLKARYFRTRTWAEIGSQFEDLITREVIPIKLTAEQTKVSRQLDEDMIAYHDNDVVVTPSVLAKMTRLYQLATCPQALFRSMGYGAIIDDLLERIEDDPHTVVYTYFTEAIPLMRQAFEEAGHGNVFSLKGGMSLKEVDETVARWKESQGIMLCSIRFAESFRIDTTHTAYMVGFSWDPNDNIQAEGRLRAIDSELNEPVIVYYYIADCPIMEAVKDVVNNKVRTVSQVFADYKRAAHDG